jgi:hypothetical protein
VVEAPEVDTAIKPLSNTMPPSRLQSIELSAGALILNKDVPAEFVKFTKSSAAAVFATMTDNRIPEPEKMVRRVALLLPAARKVLVASSALMCVLLIPTVIIPFL